VKAPKRRGTFWKESKMPKSAKAFVMLGIAVIVVMAIVFRVSAIRTFVTGS
jgi:hypothetical protein